MPRLVVYGVRGSIARPEKEFMKYGGNTTCYALHVNKNHVVMFDMGTGFYKLANELKRKGFKGRVDVLLSHGHLDHIYSSVFSAIHFNPDVQIRVFGTRDTLERLKNVFNAERGGWPLGPDNVPNMKLIEVKPGEHREIGDNLKFETYSLSHHGEAIGYTLHVNGKRISYLVDHQPAEMGVNNPNKLGKPEEDRIIGNSDIAIVDSHFEKEKDIKWGHGSIEFWVKRYQTLPEKLKLIMTHYSPELRDEDIDRIKESLIKKFKRIPIFAREGLRLEI